MRDTVSAITQMTKIKKFVENIIQYGNFNYNVSKIDSKIGNGFDFSEL